MEMTKSLIIIPTFNEVENIAKLIHDIKAVDSNLHVLVVDDNSPDGTAQRVNMLKQEIDDIYLIEREGKKGLGTAYVAGFKFALQNGYEYIFEMDADFSHDPKEIPSFIKAMDDADLVIGSRYIKGVNVVNWPLSRLLLSYFANQYTRIITGLPVCDATAGYKCIRRNVLQAIDLADIHSGGYSFQIEMNFKAWKKGFRIKEIPIIFIDRALGKSKMSKKIVREAIWMVWKLKFKSMFGLLN
jgi:dolichol-phosphate mannosyltransferase